MNGEAGDPQTYRGGAELCPHVQLCSGERNRKQQPAAWGRRMFAKGGDAR